MGLETHSYTLSVSSQFCFESLEILYIVVFHLATTQHCAEKSFSLACLATTTLRSLLLYIHTGEGEDALELSGSITLTQLTGVELAACAGKLLFGLHSAMESGELASKAAIDGASMAHARAEASQMRCAYELFSLHASLI